MLMGKIRDPRVVWKRPQSPSSPTFHYPKLLPVPSNLALEVLKYSKFKVFN